MVDYLVLLKLPFSGQLEKEYEEVMGVLQEELQEVSQNQDSCQSNQCEWGLGASGWREKSGSQPVSQPVPAQTGAPWPLVPALWYLQKVGRRDTGPQTTE